MLVKKPNLSTKLTKVIPIYNEKGKKLKILLEVGFKEADPLHFSYSLLDRWIKATLIEKAILPEEAAELLYGKIFEYMQESSKDYPFYVRVKTLKADEHLNVEVFYEYKKNEEK